MLALLADLLELRLPLLPGVLPRPWVPLRPGRLTLLALLALLVLASVLALLGVRAVPWARDLLLGWLEGAAFVLAHLGDSDMLGLVTELGAVTGLVDTEGLLGMADLVVFKEAGGLGDAAGIKGPTDAGGMLGFRALAGGEGRVAAKWPMAQEVAVDTKGLAAVGGHLIALPRPTS